MKSLTLNQLEQVHGGHLVYYSQADLDAERIVNGALGAFLGGAFGAAAGAALSPAKASLINMVVGSAVGGILGAKVMYHLCEAASLTPGWYDVSYETTVIFV